MNTSRNNLPYIHDLQTLALKFLCHSWCLVLSRGFMYTWHDGRWIFSCLCIFLVGSVACNGVFVNNVLSRVSTFSPLVNIRFYKRGILFLQNRQDILCPDVTFMLQASYFLSLWKPFWLYIMLLPVIWVKLDDKQKSIITAFIYRIWIEPKLQYILLLCTQEQKKLATFFVKLSDVSNI
jgi:hypothetical protein